MPSSTCCSSRTPKTRSRNRRPHRRRSWSSCSASSCSAPPKTGKRGRRRSSGGALAGQVATVPGASSGIGEATARRLAAEGAAVVVNSSASVAAGERIAAELPASIYVQASVADESQCLRLVDETIGRYGRLDILINNAGTTNVIAHADLDAVTDDIFRRILDTNLLGTWYLTRAALPHLKKSPAGVVVNLTSIAGIRATGSSIPYAVSKAAINHF